MALRPLNRQPSLDGLDLFRRLDPPEAEGPLTDERRISAVMKQLGQAVKDTLSRPTSVRGWRAQALFASLVVALDGCQLLTFIDTGDIYFDGENLKPADYFLVLRDGRRLVVDVKEISSDKGYGFQETIKLSASEHDRLERFAELYGAELYIAAYSPVLPSWLLLPIDSLTVRSGGSYALSTTDAITVNESVIIGDYAVGVVPPLTFELIADLGKPRVINEQGKAQMTIGGVNVSSGAGQVSDPFERRILMFLLEYGSWEQREDVVREGDQLISIANVAEPPIDTDADTDEADQGFHIVGWLSGMYSRLFETFTRGDDEITALDIKSNPGLFSSLIPHDYKGKELPIWRLHMRPSLGKEKEA
jgi:hypothetical protein